MKRAGLALAVAWLLILPLVATAAAAQRYAAPAGTGTTCSRELPCSLQEAIGKSKSNDEVIVTSGTYVLSGQAMMPFESSDVDIHGDLGAPMPTIRASIIGAAIAAYGKRAHVRYLEIVNEAPEYAAGINCTTEGLVERVVAKVSGKNASALLQQNDCASRDTLLLANGQGATGLRASGFFSGYTATVRNVTAIAVGPESRGVFSEYENAFPEVGSYTLDLRNSIAAGDGADILAATGLQGPGNVVVGSSNFDKALATGASTIFDSGGNQTAPPQFVNPAAADYREAPGSPTVDAGVADALIGSLDLGGNPRTLGSAPDIGAYELVPAPIVCCAPPPIARLQSLALAPTGFRAAGSGGATAGTSKKRAPVGTTVTYGLSASGTVGFAVEKKTAGRRVGGKCVRRTKANAAKKKCPLYRKVKGGFSVNGGAGRNRFKFSGRLRSRGLKPGRYRLAGSAGGVTKTALFRILR